MKYSIPFILLILLFSSCGMSSKEKKQLNQQHNQDSIMSANEKAEEARLMVEKVKRDSINKIEEKIAISDINFEISKTEFNRKKSSFLKKSNSRLGDFFISDFDGHFYENKLYWIQLKGIDVMYDEYEKIMTYQYNSLLSVLKEKYGNPKDENSLPLWNNLDKGDMELCASWKFGLKDIDLYVRCTGAKYNLHLFISREDISLESQNEREKKEAQEKTKAVDLL